MGNFLSGLPYSPCSRKRLPLRWQPGVLGWGGPAHRERGRLCPKPVPHPHPHLLCLCASVFDLQPSRGIRSLRAPLPKVPCSPPPSLRADLPVGRRAGGWLRRRWSLPRLPAGRLDYRAAAAAGGWQSPGLGPWGAGREDALGATVGGIGGAVPRGLLAILAGESV